MLVCGACRGRPASMEWAEMDRKQAVGDKCMKCCKQWSAHFMHLSWDEYADLMASEEPLRDALTYTR